VRQKRVAQGSRIAAGCPRARQAPLFVGIVVACGLVGVKNAVGAVAVEPTVGTFVDLVHICRGEAPLAKKPACETITVVDHFQRTVTLSRHSCVRAELLAAVSVNFRSCQRGLANSDPGASVSAHTRGGWSTAAKQNQRALDRTDSMKNFWVESHRDANEEHSRGEEHAGRSHERDIPTAKRDYSSIILLSSRVAGINNH